MPHVSMATPLGSPITIFEWSGFVSAIGWGVAPDEESTPALETACNQLEAFFSGRRTGFDFPINPGGTPFQRRVWQCLREIPFGTTTTYAALARVLGTAPRAVGSACARNRLPIVIPCHRVLGTNGGLTGYSASDGIATKKLLLRLEGIVLD